MKTRSLVIGALLAAGALVGSPAFAQAYAGASIGQSRVDLDCTGADSCDKTGTAFKLFGGYMFTPNLGVEGAYYNQGKATVSGTDAVLGNVTGEFKGDGFGLYGVAVAPFDQFSVFGKLGVVSSKIKVTATSSNLGTASDSESKTKIAWGIGGGYDFSRNLGARLEFERVRVEFMDEKTDVDLITVGLVYRF
jgi:OOP family OmpA-OmpF porin